MVINASWGDYSSSPYNDIFRDDGDSARWNALHDAITAARDAPEPPRQTFREWWRKEHGDRP